MIDGYASERVYLDHVASVWRALPDVSRGTFRVPPHRDDDLVAHAKRLGIEAQLSSRFEPSERRLLVAAGRDLKHPGRRHILLEHGAGQTYGNEIGGNGYAGGPERGTVDLFLCPSQRVADLNLARYPNARAAVIGVPKLDAYWDDTPFRFIPDIPHIVVSTHWNGGPCAESLPAWQHYRRAYAQLQHVPGWRVSKHAHPKWAGHVRRDLAGMPFIEDLTEVFETADVFVCDNSSAQYETAALGIPNVVVNDPGYRRDISHGLRFWSHVPGPQVNEPEDLAPTIARVLREPRVYAAEGYRVATEVYDGLLDGQATGRAIRAIMAL